jgi:hypothetical protein
MGWIQYNVDMKMMLHVKRSWITIFLLVGLFTSPYFLWSGSLDDVEEQSEETKKYLSALTPDAILQRKSLSVHIYFFAKGSSEEGFHGVLYRNGHEVMPSSNMIKFKHYPLKYFGSFESRAFASSRSGWLPKDLRMIPPAGTGKTFRY